MQPFQYTANYCEENVWHLCRHPEYRAFERVAVFISTPDRYCPIWCQRNATEPGTAAIWDYHVVFVYRDAGWQVLDFDTVLTQPVGLADYLEFSFPEPLAPEFNIRFRIVDAEDYLSAFSSDRSHMLGEDGCWLSLPPDWPPILDGAPNLQRFIDVEDAFIGTILTLPQIRRFAEHGVEPAGN